MNIVGISGSATGGSSTDLLVQAVLEGVSAPHVKTRFYRLNERQIMPCQACGKSPEPSLRTPAWADYCFFHDGMEELFREMEKAEAIVLGSPIYFDSVSAQTKLFIDRTNCLRPADFSDKSIQKFKEPRFKDKKGGIILVAGDYGKFEGALRTARAFFIWAGIEIVFELKYKTKSLEVGEAANDVAVMAEAREMGTTLRNVSL
jgi:multimeric flavodoxin WrbA